MDNRTSSNALKDTFDRRSFVVGGVQGGVGLLLAARMGYIAVAENEKYEMEAESNRVNLSLIPPRRGWILDRNGSPLASNRTDFRVDVIPDRMVDAKAEIDALGKLLRLEPQQIADLHDKIDESRGFQPVEVAAGVEYDAFAAVTVRLPDLPGVIPQRGYTRFYPTGPSVSHLIGYVGAASAEEFEADPNPLLVTPGYKVGKDGLEKDFEQTLRGVPGARRVEVTAQGRIVRDLETRSDIQGDPIKLTIDGPLQDFASRRIGLESAAVVVIDCDDGAILAMTSMPAPDPNSFIGGIGRLRWQMLNEDDHIPLLNKAVRGLYPPGSTVKPMATLALQSLGVDPEERVACPGGYRLGSRFFRCDAVHGSVNMRQSIEHSCNSYYWSMAHKYGYDAIAERVRLFGLGTEFDLPGTSQRYGTVPDSTWKMRKYDQEWTGADSLNAVIGQGYVLASPLQLAVMTARIASGRDLQPHLLYGQARPQGSRLPFTAEQFQVTREGMSDVINGRGTGRGVRIDINGVLMAGKTGTAQVRTMISRGHISDWASRDHSHFICFAPADKPKYAMAVTVEHGGFGSRAAAPIAKDVMTYLFDPETALDNLHRLEESWGGKAGERMERKYEAYVAAANGPPPAPEPAEGEETGDNGETPSPTPTPSASPTPQASATPAPAASPQPVSPPSPAATPEADPAA